MKPSLLRDLRDSLANPSYWAYSTWLEIVAKYRRSRLGLVWAMVPAVAYIWGMGMFFGSMRDIPVSKMIPHVAFGTIAFRLVTNVVTESSGVFGAQQSFILDNRIRLTDLLLRTLAKGLFYVVVAMPVLASALWVADRLEPVGLLVSFGMLFVVMITALWLSTLMAIVGARFPDMQELIGSVVLFAYVLTPIIWFKDDMPPGTLRGDVMRLNPMFHLIEVFRAPAFGEPVEAGSIEYVAVMTVVGVLASIWAYRRYARQVPIWI